MSDEYTPTTDTVRAIYGRTPIGALWRSSEEAFDRWLAGVIKTAREEERERIAQDIRDDLTVRPLAGHDGIRDAALIAEGRYAPPHGRGAS